MCMQRFELHISTDGNNDVINLSPLLRDQLTPMKLEGEGLLHLFVAGSTAAITTLEFEPGLVKHDLANAMQRIAPHDVLYEHEQTWHDDNGHSHVRAALVGPGVVIPVSEGRLLTGEWQQVVLIDFDTRPRRRVVICTII